jgi:hypothetical protein
MSDFEVRGRFLLIFWRKFKEVPFGNQLRKWEFSVDQSDQSLKFSAQSAKKLISISHLSSAGETWWPREE